MSREWFARIAAQAYPSEARTARADELVGTLLEAGEESLTAFVRQLGSVFTAGITTRARIALTRPMGSIAGYALAWAAVMTVFRSEIGTLSFAMSFLTHRTGRIVYPAGTFVTWVLPALVVLAFTLKWSRLSGLLGIALIVSRLVLEPVLDSGWEIAQLVFPAAGFLLMTIAPARIPSSGRWVFVVPAAMFLYFDVSQVGLYSGLDIIVPLLVALCFLPIAPAFAIGTGLAWSVPAYVGLLAVSGPGRWTAFSIALIACMPLTVTAAWLGRRQATRPMT